MMRNGGHVGDMPGMNFGRLKGLCASWRGGETRRERIKFRCGVCAASDSCRRVGLCHFSLSLYGIKATKTTTSTRPLTQ